MKRFALFAGILVSAMCMLDAMPADSSEPIDGGAWPPRQECTNLPTLKFDPANLPPMNTFKLFVGRIMTIPYTPSEDPTAPNNLCSPLSFIPGTCEGTEFYVKINEDGSKVVKLAAYNAVTDNVMCYTQSAEHIDPYYHVFKAKIDKMVLIDNKGEPTEVTTVPQEVVRIGDTMITTLKYGKDLSYAIYASCTKSAVWVAYSENVIKENLLDGLKSEVDAALTELGFDPAQFINIPTSISINLDSCWADA